MITTITFGTEKYTHHNPAQGIYRITSKHTGECYFGSSSNIVRRVKDHLRLLKKGSHQNPKLQSYYDKYGIEDLTFSIVEILQNSSRKEVYLKEQYYIDTFSPVLNLSPLASSPPLLQTKVLKYTLEGNFVEECSSVAEAARELKIAAPNIFDAMSGVKKLVGGFQWRPFTEKYSKSIGVIPVDMTTSTGISQFWKTGKYVIHRRDLKTKKSIKSWTSLEVLLLEEDSPSRPNLLSHLRNPTENKSCRGFLYTCREFTSLAPSSYQASKPVSQFDQEGTLIRTFQSCREASRALDVDKSAIDHAVKSGRNCKGFKWRYLEAVV